MNADVTSSVKATPVRAKPNLNQLQSLAAASSQVWGHPASQADAVILGGGGQVRWQDPQGQSPQALALRARRPLRSLV